MIHWWLLPILAVWVWLGVSMVIHDLTDRRNVFLSAGAACCVLLFGPIMGLLLGEDDQAPQVPL